jgi:hypothetical protein
MITALPHEASITTHDAGPDARADVRLGSRSGVLLFGGGRLGALVTDAVVAWVERGPDSEPLTVTAAAYTRLTHEGVACASAASGAGVHWALREAVRT